MKDTITALRNIVEHKQHAKINGQRIDLFTASAIMAVHDRLSPEAQAKLAAMPLLKMAAICLKLVR